MQTTHSPSIAAREAGQTFYGFSKANASDEPAWFHTPEAAARFSAACGWDNAEVETTVDASQSDILDTPENPWTPVEVVMCVDSAIATHVASLSADARADIAAGRWDEVMTDALFAACGARTQAEMREAKTLAQIEAENFGQPEVPLAEFIDSITDLRSISSLPGVRGVTVSEGGIYPAGTILATVDAESLPAVEQCLAGAATLTAVSGSTVEVLCIVTLAGPVPMMID